MMEKETFQNQLAQHSLPVVVDVWAAWCGPCKSVKPILEKLALEYTGRVDLWQVNADENPDLLRELHIYGIPTLIVYRNGVEVSRQMGAKSAGELKNLFESLASGTTPAPAGLSNRERLIRFGLGLVVLTIGWMSNETWYLLGLGVLLMFSAFYDRWPLWQALSRRYKALTGQA